MGVVEEGPRGGDLEAGFMDQNMISMYAII